MSNETTVTGGRELAELLATLAPKIEKNIMRAALRAGAVVVRGEARSRVPRSSGALFRSVRITTRSQRGQAFASVKAGNAIAFYAHMVEFGTRPHRIQAAPGSALDVAGNPLRSVEHSGSRPRPFMRPAAEAAFAPAVDAIQAKIRERLTAQGLNTPAPIPPEIVE